MFKSDQLRSALEQASGTRRTHIGGGMPLFLLEQEESRRPMKIALIVGVIVHVALFAITFPKFEPEPRRVGTPMSHFVVQQVRFQPPAPRQQIERPKPRKKKKTIPVPDPTPDDPEPITFADVEVDETEDLLDIDGMVGIPEGPPSDGRAGAMALSGNIAPPVKVFSPQPLYTEDARRAGIQGVVILEAVVDAEGTVRNVKILKGLPMGLDQSAVDAVMTWKYRPATLNGEPVPVYFTFTISFSLT
jgi:TonB family protein